MTYDYDLFVIGAGSGGVRAARLSANLGLKVAIAEEDRPGGTCVLRGCVPKKFMVYASEVPEQLKYARGFGWDIGEAAFDWDAFKASNEKELTRLSQAYTGNLTRNGVEIIAAHAAFKDPHTLTLTPSDGSAPYEVTAKTILIAVGGWPFLPRHIEGVQEYAISSNEVFNLPEMLKSVIIVGGGYISVEFAGVLNGLGVDVTLVYRGEQILRGFDDEVRDHLAMEMQARGIKILTRADPVKLEKTPDGIRVHLNTDIELMADQVLYASGRKPKTEGLNLEAAGCEIEVHGAIKVDNYSRTCVDHIWAVGDVTNRMNLTPVAIREAVAFVETAFKNNPTTYDYENIPTAVFSQPQIGTVGLSEQQAIEAGIKFDVYTTRFRAMKTTFIGGETRVLMKLIVEQGSDVVLGCHMVGVDSAEIIQMAGIAVKARLTKSQWDATCAVHPTAAEEFVTLKDKRV
ncbi:glutathione-disulfide reductase [Asticcacaulis sp. SL142]|uniref:glutathione-disulfide reductase n=1 Tax=Asticcacaulis sp. SL142 TaxID=2995155 RepID=UPI00226C6F83|nr:glutathione-disulfide reductase [Asticcacaulis sp. SL142]WAC49125.1 glutathione-disulfide reductase [Asticcacaulis sp. SL142]